MCIVVYGTHNSTKTPMQHKIPMVWVALLHDQPPVHTPQALGQILFSGPSWLLALPAPVHTKLFIGLVDDSTLKKTTTSDLLRCFES